MFTRTANITQHGRSYGSIVAAATPVVQHHKKLGTIVEVRGKSSEIVTVAQLVTICAPYLRDLRAIRAPSDYRHYLA